MKVAEESNKNIGDYIMTEQKLITDICLNLTKDPGGIDPIELVVSTLHELHLVGVFKYDCILFDFGSQWINNILEGELDLQKLVKDLQSMYNFCR